MLIAFLISAAAAVASLLWLQPEAAPQAAVANFEQDIEFAAPLHRVPDLEDVAEASPETVPEASAELLVNSPTPTIFPTSTPAPTEQPAPSPTPLEDCDGKEIHVERHDGEDVSIEVVCDKQVEGSGSVSNSVSVDASTGGAEGNSGSVKVDLNISNRVGDTVAD